MSPSRSPGSSQRVTSVMCMAYVIWPSGAARAGAVSARTRIATRSRRRMSETLAGPASLVAYATLRARAGRPAIPQTDTVPVVRVPWNDPATIMKALDLGAYGIIVPLINTAEDAAKAVAACRYPPVGMRSSGPVRAVHYGGSDYIAKANDEIVVMAMIETKEGLANLDAICATPGLDAVYIGPSDLSFALGMAPRGDNPDPVHISK